MFVFFVTRSSFLLESLRFFSRRSKRLCQILRCGFLAGHFPDGLHTRIGNGLFFRSRGRSNVFQPQPQLLRISGLYQISVLPIHKDAIDSFVL